MKSRDFGFRFIARILLLSLGTSFSVAEAAATWPSYNGTLASDRYATPKEINSGNIQKLKVVCEYDSKEEVSFQTGLIQDNGALYGTTEHDTFSLNPDTCKENWRSHEEFPAAMLKVNRGAALIADKIVRGTSDGRVLAYNANTGKKLWETSIGDAKKGEAVNAAPVAFDGMIYIGTAGGDNKGVKGRMYALNALDGKIVWEFYLVPKEKGDLTRGPEAESPSDARGTWKNAADVPITGGGTWTSFSIDMASKTLYVPGGNPAPDFVKDVREGENLYAGSVVALDTRTGAYKKHYPVVLDDFHDWDVSSAPALIKTKAGKKVMAVTPKDGFLYLFDLQNGRRFAKMPMTTIQNEKEPLTVKGVHFCPGTQGGSEWNGPAYNPSTNLIYSGQVDWCATVKLDAADTLKSVASGQPWTGSKEAFGKLDDKSDWKGWVVASDADTGKKVWGYQSKFPILAAILPTAGGLVFAGDMGGNLVALDARDGKKLWSTELDGALGGGIISYDTGAGQKIAVAAGMTSPIWITKKTRGKVVVYGI